MTKRDAVHELFVIDHVLSMIDRGKDIDFIKAVMHDSKNELIQNVFCGNEDEARALSRTTSFSAYVIED